MAGMVRVLQAVLVCALFGLGCLVHSTVCSDLDLVLVGWPTSSGRGLRKYMTF